jgi:zinc D-Ala-D-Ala carboxypeptidase
MEFFVMPEFQCPCCGICMMDKKLLKMLDDARRQAGIPFRINSGFRCEKHNEKVKGKKDSSHLIGKAVDIAASNGWERLKIVKACLTAGLKRVGVSGGFIHVDNDGSKPSSLWTY